MFITTHDFCLEKEIIIPYVSIGSRIFYYIYGKVANTNIVILILFSMIVAVC